MSSINMRLLPQAALRSDSEQIHWKLLDALKGQSSEILQQFFFHAWIGIGLNMNCFWSYNIFYKPPQSYIIDGFLHAVKEKLFRKDDIIGKFV